MTEKERLIKFWLQCEYEVIDLKDFVLVVSNNKSINYYKVYLAHFCSDHEFSWVNITKSRIYCICKTEIPKNILAVFKLKALKEKL